MLRLAVVAGRGGAGTVGSTVAVAARSCLRRQYSPEAEVLS